MTPKQFGVQPGENASGSGQSGSDVETDEDFDVVENRGASEDDDNSIIADSTASNTNSSCRPDDDFSFGDHQTGLPN
ncbi:unnamed protein product [Allacma fusca]|uniref:Uncharacterized protein n=1 Tax=Allacma fusca TaxID=39272 RepID=A0A8J2KSD0_9HEXA|nr:unnamed protein product [Allacma fusca]